ncbi:hypothetical protein [Novipirellula aureliae]|uniref:hypothetical protein n=1 Tax=Novipirellula aureliae TaxID=2527966 RepID=UPI0018CD0187|nr:hypothetical protein [Novipirellula aureliae]
MNQNPLPSNTPPALFIGIDWADQAHDCYIIAVDKRMEEGLNKHPDGSLFTELRGAGPTLAARPGRLRLAEGSLEQR